MNDVSTTQSSLGPPGFTHGWTAGAGLRVTTSRIATTEGDCCRFASAPILGTLEASDAFQPEQFDGICAYNILHLVEDRPDTLRRIFSHLKPGGFFISSTVCLGESLVPYRSILAVMRWLRIAPPVAIIRAKDSIREIRDAGFVDISKPDVGAKKIVSFVVATKPR